MSSIKAPKMDSNSDSPITATAIKLPVLNVSDPTPETADQILAAATKYGFLYIDTEGTSFTKTNIDKIFEISREFFNAPDEQKLACQIDDRFQGWTDLNEEVLDPNHQRKGDFKESFNLAEFDGSGNPQQTIPPVLNGHLKEIFQFQNMCHEACMKVLKCLAVALKIEEPDFFTSRHVRPSGTVLRFLRYPVIPDGIDYNPEIDVRAGAHSDYGSVTLLFQRVGQPGLQVKTPDDTWAPVDPIPAGFGKHFPPILVNIGDTLSYWTNGLLKSTVHRVIFPKSTKKGGADRYSIAYFCVPTDTAELVPVPSKIVQGMKPIEEGVVGYGGGATATRATTAKEHLTNRLKATYVFSMKA